MTTPNDGEYETLRLYAWMASDLDEDGTEAPIVFPPHKFGVPLIVSDKEYALSLETMVASYIRTRGISSARLVQFDRGMTLKVVG